jgi:hypothetical protein
VDLADKGVKAMKCASCGAEIAASQKKCEYCGSQTPKPAPMPVQNAGEAQTSEAIFEAIRQSPAYRDREEPERLERLPNLSAAETIVPVIFGCFFTVVASVMLFMFLGGGLVAMGGFGAAGAIPMLMAVVPFGFVCVGIAIVVVSLKKKADFSSAPILAQAAVTTAKRTSVSGSKDTAVRTSLFMTFEFEDGTRVELRPVAENLFGQIAEGDAGVLFSRSDVALDFDRVRME